MADPDDTLESRVRGLGDDAALEALNLLAGDLLGATSDAEALVELSASSDLDGTEISRAVSEASPKETAELARMALMSALDSGKVAEVEDALASVGEKAFIVETAVIGLLALAVIHTLLTRGERSTKSVATVTIEPDGTITYQLRETTENFSVGEAIAPLAQRLLGMNS